MTKPTQTNRATQAAVLGINNSI